MLLLLLLLLYCGYCVVGDVVVGGNVDDYIVVRAFAVAVVAAEIMKLLTACIRSISS